MKKNKKGICIIVFGYSGAGKTSLSKFIHPHVEKKIGKTLLIDGNDFRELLYAFDKKYGYTLKDRSKSAISVYKILNIILDQNINVIYNNIGLNKFAHQVWQSNIKNLINVYIDAKIKNIINFGKKKKIYKLKKDVVGVHIKSYLPKNINIKVKNDFKTPLQKISKELIIKLNKIL
tara:strand:- start:70 stop:597 length:528 start_codon:yes stop_codon:yes gene_type:complete